MSASPHARAKKPEEKKEEVKEETKEEATVKNEFDENGCIPSLPNLIVGDVFLEDSNFYEYRKTNKFFVLGVSDGSCATCCRDEPLLYFLKKYSEERLFTYKGQPIPIARIDMS